MTTTIASFADLTAAIDAVVAGMYANHTASAAKRGKNPKFPYVPVVKEKIDMYSGVRTTNPTRNRAYATREEAVAVAQRYIDHYRAQKAHDLIKPSHRADREWRGLPREIDALLAEVGRLTVEPGTRIVMTWGKHRGQTGTVRILTSKGRGHCIDLDNGEFLVDVEAVDFDRA